MKANDFDVLIIGGGATGGGTALDLALRGLLVERVAPQPGNERG